MSDKFMQNEKMNKLAIERRLIPYLTELNITAWYIFTNFSFRQWDIFLS